jgi:acyl transferase domain-containing protein/surfactin synthase thioesterase subunit/D-arabinose 1-dehydrogenase-like Zn-dependent alcohol dehydrogenase/acyl carrier protein
MRSDPRDGQDMMHLVGEDETALSPQRLRGWITDYLAKKVGVERTAIAPGERFQRLGLDSLGATTMLVELSKVLGRALSPTLAWEYPSPDSLANHLAGVSPQHDPQAKPAQPQHREDEPIAIVGMACRFPKAPNLEAFWALLRDGVDAITEVPKDRWDTAALYDPDPGVPGKMSTKWAGLLPEVDTFDPAFFGISPREAVQVDPQQRLALELAWEALEDSRIMPTSLRDSRSGVFLGAMWMDYMRLLGTSAESIAPHTATGQDLSIVAARISYTLGLGGPSLVVNTACSSALVAVHLACQSLLRGESRLCLAGGINLLLAPESSIAMSKFGAMAKDGRCKAFDASANGYVRGEGGGIVVLKRRSDALADGDRILCLIRGSAVNNDGFSNGLTAPSPQAQESVLRDACLAARVEPSAIEYVEAHGTGTILGDPIEAGALGAVLGRNRQGNSPLRIGSVKTNIGHLEAAAGIAGLIKVVLALQHRTLPQSLHFERPNPHIPFETLGLCVQTKTAPWESEHGKRLAGVSAFGFGGTNCHVVLEEATQAESRLFLLSADSEEALRTAAQMQEAALRTANPPSVPEICAAAERADARAFRMAVPTRSRQDLARQLQAFANHQNLSSISVGQARAQRPRIAFVFGGQGSQWRGMGRALLRRDPVARSVLQKCDQAFRRHVSWSLLERLTHGDGPELDQSELVQPALFAIQAALSAALGARGLIPDAVVGQSMGEIAAAYVAGALSLDDAAVVICQRSQLVTQARGKGGMAVLALSLAATTEALLPFADRLSVAVSSSPQMTVVAGGQDALAELVARLTKQGVFCRPVGVDYASHSSQMDPLLPELKRRLAGLTPQFSPIDFYSTVTQTRLVGSALDGSYWARNLREPVQFASAIQSLLRDGVEAFVEVDPHPVLTQAIEQCVAALGQTCPVVAVANRDEDEPDTLLDAVGKLWTLGVPVLLSPEVPGPPAEPKAELLVLSARSEAALLAQAARLRQHLLAHPEQNLQDVAFSLATTRSALEYRLAIAATSQAALLDQLQTLQDGLSTPGAVRAHLDSGITPKLVFVFPGQGSQWLGMGRALLAQEPAFRQSLADCDAAIQAEAGFSVLAELAADERSSRLSQIEVVQPLLFAISVALASLFRSWGVVPDAVVGHSMGEVAAAHFAGILSLRDAVAVICRRSRLLTRIKGRGEMALVELSLPDAHAAIRGFEDALSVAVSNGPRSTVLSGSSDTLAQVLASLDSRGVFWRRVNVDVASHSPQVEPLSFDLLGALASIVPQAAVIPMRSTVTCSQVHGAELRAEYWVDNLRLPVRFHDAILGLAQSGHSLFIELSPHPILLPAVDEILHHAALAGTALPSLRRTQPERATLLESLGALWTHGIPISWSSFFPPAAQRVDLPTYPWQRQRFWVETSSKHSQNGVDPLAHWFYQLEWPEVPPPAAPTTPSSAGDWLVLADRGSVGRALADALTTRGHAVTLLVAGAPPSVIIEHLTGHESWRGIVYLGGLDAIVPADTQITEVGEITQAAMMPLLAAMQVLSKCPTPPHLWIVTRGACLLGTQGNTAPCQTTLWGLGRVAALEHPAARAGLLDLDPQGDPTEIEMLACEILSPDAEDQVVFRGRRRHAARLSESAKAPHSTPLALTAEGSYLITGGLGALGHWVAKWLVERGARHIILTSRHSLPARAEWDNPQTPELRSRIAAIKDLESQGAQVTVSAVDVGDFSAMQVLLSGINPPLRGVVHTAGVVTDGLLAHQDGSRLRQVLHPKVLGAWNLHVLTREQPLDFFILFSSIATALGLMGQGTYAAANAFLDGLAAMRRTQGLPALSIDWGLWEGGMGSAAQREHYDELGIQLMPRQLALSAMERLLRDGTTQCIVTRMNWQRLREATRSSRAWKSLLSALPLAAEPPPPASASRWLAPADRNPQTPVLELVRRTVAEVLGTSQPQMVAPNRGFTEQGLDSLMAVQIRNRLQKELGTTLSSTIVFDHPTVEKLTAHLLNDVLRLRSDVVSSKAQATKGDEAIAVIGAACRLPGGADDLDAYWRLLASEVVAVSDVPSQRWNPVDWYDPRPQTPNRTYVKKGGFLRDVETFDAEFFRISPREALSLDPQQRLLLELTWEALERAGSDPVSLRDSLTGVFIGVVSNEYGERVQLLDDDMAKLYTVTGNSQSVTAGRLSYFLGLQGPSLAVDTACSSSLVALHLACQSLRQGECETALVGGVNLLLSPTGFVNLSQLRALAADGRCKTFSASADGFGRAEGGAVVVLKRLSAAQRDGDQILGIIRATAVNHDGASSGLTVPNGPAQQAVLRTALEHAGVEGSEVDFVECHGTGTSLGDPIEVQALASVYGSGRPKEHPLLLGAAKANLGHLEAASGLVGVLKVLLALQHEQIPAQPQLGALNPLIPWSELPVRVVDEAQPWPPGSRPRRAGVSAFGISGTNAHVVIEEAPRPSLPQVAPVRAAELVLLSAKSEAALLAQAARLHDHVQAHPEQSLADMAFSLLSTRSAMECRLAVAATSRMDLQTQLAGAARGELPATVIRGAGPTDGSGKVVFVFPGQGSQWLGMGRGLLAEEPTFRAALVACDHAIQKEAGFSVIAEFTADEGSSQLHRVDVIQPVLFAMSVALAALWRSWGVEPDVVVGHSLGEVAAAHVAGALSLPDAAAIICRRSRLLRKISGQGEMALVQLSLTETAAVLADYSKHLSVAVSNSPRSTVISGEPGALAEVLSQLESRGIFGRRVKVDVASHSPQVEPLLDELRTLLSKLRPQPCVVPMRSTVTGQDVQGPELSAEYWAQNLRQPVRFGEVMQGLLQSGYRFCLELSAHPILVPATQELWPAQSQSGAAIGSLRRGQAERAALLSSLGELWVHGYALDGKRLFPQGGRAVELPTYAWQRQRYWVDGPTVRSSYGGRVDSDAHPLLGTMHSLSTQSHAHLWETTLELRQLPWLQDHRVQGAVVFPGAAYLEMALACGRQLFGAEPFEVTDVSLIEALVLTGDTGLQLQVVTSEDRPGRLRMQVASRELPQTASPFRFHARGTLSKTKPSDSRPRLNLPALCERLHAMTDTTGSYASMATMGLEYGPSFRGIHALWCHEGEALGRVVLPSAAGAADRYQIHPALFDACLQVVVEALGPARGNTPWLPVQIGSFQLFQRPGSELYCHVQLAPPDPASSDRRRTDLCIVDPEGDLVAEIKDLAIRRRVNGEQDGWFVAVDWQPSAVPTPSVTAGRWLLLGDGGSLGRTLREELISAGHSVVQGESLLPNSTALRALLTGSFGDKAPTAVVHLGRVGVESVTSSNIAEKALLQGCDSVLHVVQALLGMWYREVPRLWLFTRGAQAVSPGPVALTQAPLLGLGRTIAVEHPELRCVLVDLDPAHPEGEAAAVLAELLADDAEDEVALRGGERLVARLVHRSPEAGQSARTEPARGRPFRLSIEKLGVLDHVLPRICERRPPALGEVEIAVEAAGLNFADVLKALGIYPGTQGRPVVLGGECAGRITAIGEGISGLHLGQDVIAIAPGSFGTHVTVSAQNVVRRPPQIEAVQAAALPLSYMTAWYALVHLGRLRAGERVLIHSATGGTGLAAIHIARHLGAEVLATAGTEAKREWLRRQGIAAVMDSRSFDFSDQVLAATGGEGVDVVLNSLSGPAIEASLAVLGQDGRFIELGKTDIYANRALELGPFKKSLSYHAVDLAALGEHRPQRFAALLAEVMSLIEKGMLPPLPVEAVPIARAVDAFRKMAQTQHIGKLVLTLCDLDGQVRVPVRDKVTIRGDASYLVTGGLGGLGLKVAEWLAKQGAGHLILMRRAGDLSFEQRAVVSALAARGTRVSIAKGDVGNRAQLEKILADIHNSGMPLRGIIHAAGTLDDGLVMQQTPLRFRTVMGPKVQGAWHLHELTRKQPLDFFVMYASAAGLLGSPGQANYAAANTFLDALAHHRRSLGLPALSIDWGAFSEVGLAAAQDNRGARLASRGMHSLTPEQGIDALGRLLAGAQVQMGVVAIDMNQWGAAHRATARSRRLSPLQTKHRGEPRREQEAQELLARLVTADPAGRAAMLTEILLLQVAQVLRLPETQIAPSAPLTTLGMDSLMGLDLRNRIESVLGIRLPASLLLTHPTVNGLADHIKCEIEDGEQIARKSYIRTPATQKLIRSIPDSTFLPPEANNPSPSRGIALVRIHIAPTPKLHLICFPPGGGGPELFLRWTTKMPDSISISGLHLPGRGARLTETPYSDISQLLDGICEELVHILKEDTPVAFVGHSLGSIIAFETAQQLLRTHGVHPIHLYMSACPAPHRGAELEHQLGFGTQNASSTFSSDTLSDAELLGALRRAGALGRGAEKLDDDELAAFFVPALRADLRVLRSYRQATLAALPVPITAIVGRHDPLVDANQITDWMKYTSGSFAARIIPADHGIRYEQLWNIISATLAPL